MPKAPFAVRALYEYQADEEDDLPFAPGQRLTVDEVLDDDWYHGYYIDSTTEKRREGIFPINYVEIEAPPSRPSRPAAPRQTNLKQPVVPSEAESTRNETAKHEPVKHESVEHDQVNRESLKSESKGLTAKNETSSSYATKAVEPVNEPAKSDYSNVVSKSATPIQPRVLTRPSNETDDWDDSDDDEDDKEITIGAPKLSKADTVTSSNVPYQPIRDTSAEPANEPTAGRESHKEGGNLSTPKESLNQLSTGQYHHSDNKSIKPPSSPIHEAAEGTESESEIAAFSPGNSYLTDAYSKNGPKHDRPYHEKPAAVHQLETTVVSAGPGIDKEAFDPIDTAPKTSRPSHESPLSVDEDSESEVFAENDRGIRAHKEGISSHEPDFKTRLARFNQGVSENPETEVKQTQRPERKAAFGRTMNFQDSSEDNKVRRDSEDFKPSVSLKERIAMLQQSQQQEEESAQADAAAEARRQSRREKLAAEVDANRKAHAELDAKESEEQNSNISERRSADDDTSGSTKELPGKYAQHDHTQERHLDDRLSDFDFNEVSSPTGPPPVPVTHEFGKNHDDSGHLGEKVSSPTDRPKILQPPNTGIVPPLSPDNEKEGEGHERRGSEDAEDEDSAEARRIALRERMARLAKSSGGMNLGMIMGGGTGYKPPGGGQRERKYSRSEYESMSPAEIEAAEARREAEESAPISMFGNTTAPPPKEARAPVNEEEEGEDYGHSVPSATPRSKEFLDPVSEAEINDSRSEELRSPLEGGDDSDLSRHPSILRPPTHSVSKFDPENESDVSVKDAEEHDIISLANAHQRSTSNTRELRDPSSTINPQKAETTQSHSPVTSVIPPVPGSIPVPSPGTATKEASSPQEHTPVVTSPPKVPAPVPQAAGQPPPPVPSQPAARPPPPTPSQPAARPPPPTPSQPVARPPPPTPSQAPVSPGTATRTAHPPPPPPPVAGHSPAVTSPPTVPTSLPQSAARPVPPSEGSPRTWAPEEDSYSQSPRSPVQTSARPPPIPPAAPHQVYPAAEKYHPAEATKEPQNHSPILPPATPAPSVPHTAPSVPSTAPPPEPGAVPKPRSFSQASVSSGAPPPFPVARPVKDEARHEQTTDSHETVQADWLKSGQGVPPNLISKGDTYKVTDSNGAYQYLVIHPDWSQTLASFSTSSGDLLNKQEFPPPTPDSSKLKQVSSRLGPHIVASAQNSSGPTDSETSREWCVGVLNSVTPVLLTGSSFGIEIYKNIGNASVQQQDDIRPGDICVCEDANFQGTKGIQKYHKTLSSSVFIVTDWDGSKRKLHILDNKKDTLRLNDLKMGVVKIYRAIDAQYLST